MINKTYIIAEAGVNHNGSIELAKQLIDIAKDSGADAIKFQTFKAENLVSKNTPKADYQKRQTGEAESQYEMLKKLELGIDEHKVLTNYCREKSIEFLSTPFDYESLDLLVNDFHISKLKVPSGEITNAPLLLKMARTDKPIILSTGMSTLGDIENALSIISFGYLNKNGTPTFETLRQAFYSEEGQMVIKEKVILLHCTTEYPTPFEDVNLLALTTLKTSFGLQVGLSDHTMGISVPIAAVAIGAVVVEKHVTVDRTLPGPDHKASLEPNELKEMVKSIREVEQAIGSPIKKPAPSELKNMNVARKSIVANCNISGGEAFNEKNITVKRPGNGISPIYYWEMLGKKATRNFKKDEEIN
ncbi:N-acetylneuraminate synthase [Anaerobacillus alkalidiazotrophicus]|uniref:N-acetylneuraminate synthase n=1 Tax=Anaerobacillus alkalidiazotrophicus TaxID=472963 RepID=A0A1S2MFA9_9BACI|nr:N-acetylneuraminate synthase [Anaerobacillus alkalidiazotrophicus]OIJ22375.1 N-acetylneuraminate synthase [Anaerobacillus alkalidiazotrophicus]